MPENNINIEQAEQLLEQALKTGNFDPFWNVANQILNNGQLSVSSGTLMLRALAHQYLPNNNDSELTSGNGLLTIAKSVSPLIDSYETLFRVYDATAEALKERAVNIGIALLDLLEKSWDTFSGNSDIWQKTIGLNVGIMQFSIMVWATLRGGCIERLEANEGKAPRTADIVSIGTQFKEDLYQSAVRIFTEVKEFHENNSNVVAEYAKVVVKKLLSGYTLTTLMLDFAMPEWEDKPESAPIAFSRLQALAEVLTFGLEATVAYPGGSVHIWYPIDQRMRIAKELEATYQKMSSIDPSFVAPPLPIIHIQAPSTAGTRSQQSGGCYVATAVYGSYDCPEVWTLRRYRDDVLASTWYGRAFIRIYYAVSPTLVKWFGQTDWFKHIWKGKLDRMVTKLQSNGVESTPYDDKNW